jgi:hypothetical protein
MAAQPVESGEPPKMLRAKSTRLPMERIPRGDELYQLVKVLPTDKSGLKKLTESLLRYDMYVSRGIQIAGLSMNPTTSPKLIQQLQETVKAWMATDGAKDCEVEFKLSNLLAS